MIVKHTFAKGLLEESVYNTYTSICTKCSLVSGDALQCDLRRLRPALDALYAIDVVEGRKVFVESDCGDLLTLYSCGDCNFIWCFK